ncbi:hypothetical protein AAF712_002677 [Marasmius tenuissimus]|uniref:Uncharacterized protein n=1 Tax=Marasmius tenuissimus TaxID=585030 RepID=A0ABR3A879_9AGAR
MAAQYAQVTIDMPRVHDALKNPEEWDKQWETILTQLDPSPEMVYLDSVRQSKMRFRDVSDLLQYYAILYTQTCEVQHRVGGRACAFLLHKDLEQRWVDAGEAVRRKHTLRALSEACSMAKNLNDARNSCGDILRLKSLSKDGKTFISLLKAMIPEDLSDIPKTPYHFPEPRWEALQKHVEKSFSANSIEKVTFDNTLVLRTKLIYHVLENMFMSFYDMPLEKVTVLKNNTATQDREMEKLAKKIQKTGMESIYGREAAKQIRKEDFEAYKDRKAQRGANVHRLTLPPSECQKKDWKVRHKTICGKPLTVETALESAPPLRPQGVPDVRSVGPTRNGFRRSPSLVEHVFKLNNNPDADIFLNTGTGQGGFMKLDFAPHPNIQKRVRDARDKAMCEGDKPSAALLCHLFVWFCWAKHADTKNGFNFKRIVEQMEKDFDFSELKQAMLELEERQRRDFFQRPPLLADLDPKEWLGFVALDYVDMKRRLDF